MTKVRTISKLTDLKTLAWTHLLSHSMNESTPTLKDRVSNCWAVSQTLTGSKKYNINSCRFLGKWPQGFKKVLATRWINSTVGLTRLKCSPKSQKKSNPGSWAKLITNLLLPLKTHLKNLNRQEKNSLISIEKSLLSVPILNQHLTVTSGRCKVGKNRGNTTRQGIRKDFSKKWVSYNSKSKITNIDCNHWFLRTML